MKSKETALMGLMILLIAALYLNPVLQVTDIPPPLFVYCLFYPLLSRRMKNAFEISIYLIALQNVGTQVLKFGGIIDFTLIKIQPHYANVNLTFYLLFYWWQLMKLRIMILIFSSLLQYIGFYKRIRTLL